MGVRGRETGRKGEKERAVLLRGAGCGGLKRGLELAFFFPKDFQRESCAQSAESPFFFLKKKNVTKKKKNSNTFSTFSEIN